MDTWNAILTTSIEKFLIKVEIKISGFFQKISSWNSQDIRNVVWKENISYYCALCDKKKLLKMFDMEFQSICQWYWKTQVWQLQLNKSQFSSTTHLYALKKLLLNIEISLFCQIFAKHTRAILQWRKFQSSFKVDPVSTGPVCFTVVLKPNGFNFCVPNVGVVFVHIIIFVFKRGIVYLLSTRSCLSFPASGQAGVYICARRSVSF